MRVILLGSVLLVGLVACGGGRVERVESAAYEPEQLADIGSTAFAQLQSKRRMSTDGSQQLLARCVVGRLTAHLPAEAASQEWEVIVMDDPGDLAFALPGENIGIESGLFAATQREDLIAAAVAHALAHLQLGHIADRIASAMSAESAEMAVQIFRGAEGPSQSRTLYSLLGLGDQVGLQAPYSSSQEAEADAFAADLMTKAGYLPVGAGPVVWRGGADKSSPWRDLHRAKGGAAATELGGASAVSFCGDGG